ncbi:MAG: roadblock/LC7 domain-containing protein [Reinekea sp.]
MPRTSDEHPLASQIRSTLRGLSARSGADISATAVMTSDGIMIASILGETIEGDTFAAMNASLLMLAKRSSSEVDIGHLKQVMVMGTEGAMLLTEVNADTVLAIATEPSANLGKTLLDTNRTVAVLQKMFDDIKQ